MTELSDEEYLVPAALTPAEQQVRTAFRRGEVCDLRTGRPEVDDPMGGAEWGPDRTVRALVLARLLLAGPVGEPGHVAALKLSGALITGLLNLSGGRVRPYVELHDCRFDTELLVSECRFRTVRLVRCALPRIEAARIATEGDLHLPQCRIRRGIRLSDAHIGTDLLLNQIEVDRDRSGRSIAADGLAVGQDMELECAELDGEFSLRSAHIGGRLNLRGSRLRNPRGRYALNAPRLTVEHTMNLGSGSVAHPPQRTPPAGVHIRPFLCEGGLRLDDGRFGDALIADQAQFRTAEGQALSLRRIQTPELRLTLDQPPCGPLSLAGARVGNLTDTRTGWPGAGALDIDGFGYESLSPQGPFPLAERLAWLAAATPEYTPEPYRALARALRNSGEDADARDVLLAGQRRRREKLPAAGRIWGYLQDITVGYGYRAGRAALWLAVLWAVGTAYFASLGTPPPMAEQAGPHWSPALFTLDVLLPFVDLGQAHAWRLAGASQWAAAALNLVGWTLATTVAAGASRLLSRS